MEIKYKGLLDLLDRHIKNYDLLGKILEVEQAALLEINLEKIQAAVKSKEIQVKRIQALVSTLSQMIQDVASDLGLPADPPPTLAEMAARMPKPWSNKVEHKALVLARMKRNIAAHSAASQAFIAESLELINGTIHILTGAKADKPLGYQQNGRKAEAGTYRPVKLSREI